MTPSEGESPAEIPKSLDGHASGARANSRVEPRGGAQMVRSVHEFLERVREYRPDDTSDSVLLYRGHPDTEFKLSPSLLRKEGLEDSERTMIKELIAAHATEFAVDTTTFDRLSRAQHYSLPTRLLDLTWNPLVALYFACASTDKCGDATNGEVIVFLASPECIKDYDSDTVSCVANLAHLSKDEKDEIDIFIGNSISREEFNKKDTPRRLVHFIRAEKPHFERNIDPQDLQELIFVRPKVNNDRLLVQSGAFLLFGRRAKMDKGGVMEGVEMDRILIDGSAKEDILMDLNAIAINDRTMFPEIDKTGGYIRSRYERKIRQFQD